MAYVKRRRITRRRPRRAPRRKFGRILVRKRPTTHYFRRKVYFPGHIVSSLIGGTGTPGSTSEIYRLSDLPNYAEFTALFDQYKILKVKMELMPRGNVSETNQQNGVNQSTFVNIYNTVDYDDSTALVSVANALEYEKVKIRRSNQRLVQYFTPAQLVETYNNGLTTGYTVNRRPKWIDCANPSIQHFATKTFLEAPTFTGVAPSGNIYVTYDMIVTYYLAFQNVI